MAAIYTALFLAGLWIFPLFPAAPKLGPVYQHVTHMVPLWFPVLVIVPAFALDLSARMDGREVGRLEIRALPPDSFSSRRSSRRNGRSPTS